MTERWKSVPGFAGYEVSDHGRVRSRRQGTLRPLSTWKDGKGYWRAKLYPSRQTVLVHRLVLLAFRGPARGRDGGHLNNDPSDSRLCNLRWMTHRETHRPQHETGGCALAKERLTR